MIKYGEKPEIIGEFTPIQPEMMYYLYLPVKMPGIAGLRMPKRLYPFWDLVMAASRDFVMNDLGNHKYIYLTAKTMFVTPESKGNREGWHCDGFGSNGDINYIWADKNPTEFAIGDHFDISTDDQQSMLDMTDQAFDAEIVTYPNNTLLRLDEGVIHRVSPKVESGIRRFIKITFSEHEFKSQGNSHNYDFNYNWQGNPRGLTRNLDHA